MLNVFSFFKIYVHRSSRDLFCFLFDELNSSIFESFLISVQEVRRKQLSPLDLSLNTQFHHSYSVFLKLLRHTHCSVKSSSYYSMTGWISPYHSVTFSSEGLYYLISSKIQFSWASFYLWGSAIVTDHFPNACFLILWPCWVGFQHKGVWVCVLAHVCKDSDLNSVYFFLVAAVNHSWKISNGKF